MRALRILANLTKQAANSKTKCSCGCINTVKTCKCKPGCSCRQKDGSCYSAPKVSLEKKAYGQSDEKALYDRYLAGGHVHGEYPDKVIEDIKKLKRESDLNKARLAFSPHKYHVDPDTDKAYEYGSDDAIRKMQVLLAQAPKPGLLDRLLRRNRKFKYPEQDADLPYYYSLTPMDKADGKPGKLDWENWKSAMAKRADSTSLFSASDHPGKKQPQATMPAMPKPPAHTLQMNRPVIRAANTQTYPMYALNRDGHLPPMRNGEFDNPNLEGRPFANTQSFMQDFNRMRNFARSEDINQKQKLYLEQRMRDLSLDMNRNSEHPSSVFNDEVHNLEHAKRQLADPRSIHRYMADDLLENSPLLKGNTEYPEGSANQRILKELIMRGRNPVNIQNMIYDAHERKRNRLWDDEVVPDPNPNKEKY